MKLRFQKLGKDPTMNFSDKIKYQREQNHLTQKELAELVGVSQRAIAAYDDIINSGTPDLVGCRNHVFCQTGCCGNQLKGGTGCGLLLRRIIEQRRRFIMLQRCKIFRIHTIGKFVAVISGITYHGTNFPCFFIRHHTGTDTWFKCKLCRRNLNVVNLFHEKIPWRQRSVFQFVYGCIIIIQYSLIHRSNTADRREISPRVIIYWYIILENSVYKKETEVVTFQGKEITLENLSPVFTPEQEAAKRRELEQQLYEVFRKYADKRQSEEAGA